MTVSLLGDSFDALSGVPQQEYFSLVLYTGVQLGRDGCCQELAHSSVCKSKDEVCI